MTPSENAIRFIKKFEDFKSDSYLCPAKIPTIGFGSTMWSDGKKVRLGQRISMEQAEKLLFWELTNKVNALPKLSVNQNMFDAICSFVYNCGVGAFSRSTMYKKINVNPYDPTIRDEFMRWINKGTPYEKGLRRRRKAEADLYFTPVND